MSFTEIGTAINTEMLKVKNTDARVGDVYNYDVKIESGINLPAIIITPVDGDELVFDSCKNTTSFNFAVRVIDEIQTSFPLVEANMRVLADIVLERLKDIVDVTWSGGQTYTVEYSYNRGYIESPNPLRVFEIICKFKGIENK